MPRNGMVPSVSGVQAEVCYEPEGSKLILDLVLFN